jgi:hypothetical protein
MANFKVVIFCISAFCLFLFVLRFVILSIFYVTLINFWCRQAGFQCLALGLESFELLEQDAGSLALAQLLCAVLCVRI